ncbi:CFI-box-CTERM domain-containing protein [Clostridium grantii]|uniref:Probable zinc-ribbon domain-containing protein n=1 Tax=Clostridium grantii DSM 8605 TaxID=1121316 RepID=A0A1M5RBT2_9CLOT|nr:CFI-box-CTERM domain-containing protein [Clostridium grantii]SHH23804.1 Probable zinc-ribbon domain-containing protein [Clostridium grantii DSM 8605]
MSITVERIAKTLSISLQETIKLLGEQGIKVSDAKSVLSDRDLNRLNVAIQRVKNENVQTSNDNAEERALNNLEYYFSNYKIFIDTCSLLHFASDQFWLHVVPIIQKTANKVIIPIRAMEEIKKHCTNTDKPELKKKAQSALENLNRLISAGLLELRGEETDNFADNVFQVVFTKFRMTHKLLLITQDGDLAADIYNLNNIKSVKANPVYVKRINKYGYLSNFDFNQNQSKERVGKSKEVSTKKIQEEETILENETFALCKKITNISDVKLPVSKIPNAGESGYVFSGEKEVEIKLIEAVASGGEGSIFTTNTPYVAKIYKKEKLDKRKYEKIKLMLSRDIKCEGICYPVACLHNNDKQFVGYLMPKANGKELQKSLFIKPLFLKNFPTWKKRDVVELCVTILEKIKYLHDRNIIMGDINPANILVVSPKEVYFVDTDSYQIEGFPCPVGTINYTAPEIQRKNFDSFLRTLGNENFAVVTLLFMIMLPGKPPYSQQGGESPIDNIVKMDFSYPFGEQSNKKTPDGPWRFIWSHLTYDLKESFYQTFRKDGETSTEKTRLSVDEWLSKFKYYLDLLDSGKLGKQDKMSEELFPNRHKKNPKVTYVKCTLCHREVPEETCRNGICKECLNTGEVYKCSKCGKEIIYSNYQKYIKNVKRHDVCQECFEYGNEVYSTYSCSDCGRLFEITNRQYDFYRSKGLNLPKRCNQCRKNKQSYSNTSSYSSPIYSRTTSSNSTSRSSGSLCFITTAVCEYFNKSDDCYELTTLRQFRDEWLCYQPEGKKLITEYYDIAPMIVNKLQELSVKDVIYNELWNNYISSCIRHIENNEYQRCKELYISMVSYLKKMFSI